MISNFSKEEKYFKKNGLHRKDFLWWILVFNSKFRKMFCEETLAFLS